MIISAVSWISVLNGTESIKLWRLLGETLRRLKRGVELAAGAVQWCRPTSLISGTGLTWVGSSRLRDTWMEKHIIELQLKETNIWTRVSVVCVDWLQIPLRWKSTYRRYATDSLEPTRASYFFYDMSESVVRPFHAVWHDLSTCLGNSLSMWLSVCARIPHPKRVLKEK